MKLRHINIQNFRSIPDAQIEVHDYTMIVGANNAGKSNIMAALRAFYDDISWTKEDIPRYSQESFDEHEKESWVELTFELTDIEWNCLADDYKNIENRNILTVRKYFLSKEKVKNKQSNIYGVVNGVVSNNLFYGAKNIGEAKLGKVIYIPAFISANDQMKTSGPSPLRDMLNLMLKRVLKNSSAYNEVTNSFNKLNEEAKEDSGFLDQISRPINEAISNWGIKFDMSINTISPDEITKNLIKHTFLDSMLGNQALSLDRYGHGFQRSFLYELIKLVPEISNEEKNSASENNFNPDFTLILFEEPEAFLHPTQQENMVYHLNKLGKGENQQVIITTHSPIFAGKATDKLCQIVRAHRYDGKTVIGQIKKHELYNVFLDGLNFKKCLQDYVNNPDIDDSKKSFAKNLIGNNDQDIEMDIQKEKFRYQLWIDSERASMFFADKVLLVEGPTEKALFNWLIANNDEWYNFTKYRISIIDTVGKFNFHRYMSLLDKFKIPYGLILDDDSNENHNKVINDMILNYPCSYRVASPVFIPDCIEPFLGICLEKIRSDLKPIEIIKKLELDEIEGERLAELKDKFIESLNIK